MTAPSSKPWPAPCGEPSEADCPYAVWLRYPKAALANVVRVGFDRNGRQRFRCKACELTFLAPPSSDGHKIGFKAYRHVEVHLARLVHQREPHRLIAARLGITTRTCEKWDHEWMTAASAGMAPQVPAAADLQLGRLVRLIQRPDLGPFSVASIDEPAFIAASIGEMRFYLKLREFEQRVEFLALLGSLDDSSLPLRGRRDGLRRLGNSIAKEFDDDLGLKLVR